MDTAPLLQWLGLPPGGWPPDDRALLGLPPAPAVVSAADAEQQALARMEKLRPHQLKHPELVTEGMNRLAQSLIAVMADAPAPAVAPPPPKPRRPAKPKSKAKLDPLPDLRQVDPRPVAPQEIDFRPTAPPPVAPKSPVVLDAEVIAEAPAQPRAPAPRAAPRPVAPAPPVAVLEPPEGTNYFPKDRRKGYRELVFLRRLRAAWGLLRGTLGDANEPLTNAEAVYELLSGSRDLAELRRREEFDRVIRGDAEGVATVATQSAVLAVIRELVPSQRWGLAVAWDAGRLAIERREKWLRERMRESKPPRRAPGNGGLGAFFRANPEWVLVALTAAALAVGMVRAIGRNAG